MALQNMSLVPLVLLCTNRIHHPGWHPLLGTQPLFLSDEMRASGK